MIKQTRSIIEYNDVDLNCIEMPAPDKVYISLMEARIKSYQLNVKEGDFVLMGQVLGERDGGYFTEPIISTVSGTIGKIVKKFNYTSKMQETLEIINDFKDTLDGRIKEISDEKINTLSKESIIQKIHSNGVKGLGGAGFPTYIKLNTNDKIDVIAVNGVECEPCLTGDYQIMKHRAEDIFKGIEIILKVVGAKKVVLGLKENKLQLYEDLVQLKNKRFSHLDIEIKTVKNYYPAGWEKSFIKDTLNIKIKSKTLPSAYGILTFNVATMAAIYDAVKYNKPIFERYFTVTGDAIKNPSETIVRIGDTVPNVIEACGGWTTGAEKVLFLGGPMMGRNLLVNDAIVSITVSSIIAFIREEWEEQPCVRCASCVYSCPVDLQPVSVMIAVKNKDKTGVRKLDVLNCIECGLCSYVCTSKIHLTDFMRKSKKLV